jgi:hypothetical protein
MRWLNAASIFWERGTRAYHVNAKKLLHGMRSVRSHTANSNALSALRIALRIALRTLFDNHNTANMGRVRTKTVKKSAKVIIEYVFSTLDTVSRIV